MARRVRPTTRWTSVDGLRVHATRDGAAGAPDVVLVPGLGMSTRSLRPLALALAADARVWAVDLPGHGRSDRAVGEPAIEDQAAALTTWLRTVGPRCPVLVGVSLGCQVAVEAAARAPGRVAAVALVSPPFDRRAPTTVQQVVRLLRTVPHDHPGIVGVVAADWLRAGPLRMARLARAGETYPLVTRVRELPVPVLVVRGDADPVAPPAWAGEVTDRAAAGRLAVVGGAGHGLHWTAPVRLARVLRDFVHRHGSRGG